MHAILRRLDADAASKIHTNDIPKLIRAIEVCLASRQKMTEMWKGGSEPLKGFEILRIGLNPDRNALYERLNIVQRRCLILVWWKKPNPCWTSMVMLPVRSHRSVTSRQCSYCVERLSAMQPCKPHNRRIATMPNGR